MAENGDTKEDWIAHKANKFSDEGLHYSTVPELSDRWERNKKQKNASICPKSETERLAALHTMRKNWASGLWREPAQMLGAQYFGKSVTRKVWLGLEPCRKRRRGMWRWRERC